VSYPQLPPGYEPYSTLEFCSNVLEHVQVPFERDGQPLLLVGKGQVPVVWLKGPADATASAWEYIVKGNRSANPAVAVLINRVLGEVRVQVDKSTVLVVKRLGPDKAVVSQLDFRPLGLDITGDRTGLRLGGTVISRNTFRTLYTAIATGTAASG
jgi:hypothetical protein